MTKEFIKQLKEKDLAKGTRLEVIVFEGAEFGSFGTRADDPEGFELGERMTQEAGERVMGYLHSVEDFRVYLTPSYNNGDYRKVRGLFYIEESCIYDVRFLIATPNQQMPCLLAKVPKGSEA
ncbi:hypothetical protein HY501_03470 [Candidatus Woesearchaeota archaeon]|nr:hypothetical protein [Candidatus Woesearchaeota archaeon]